MQTRLLLPVAACLLTTLVEAADRPNIIFIMSDDHAAQAVSAYGHALARVAPTPNIDRLAREGVLFRNAFCTNSICTPSRAVLFTGTYSHRNGVYKFTALDQSQPTLPKMLQAGGYETAFIGKWHLHSNPVGFDHWSILPGQGRYHRPQFIEQGDESASGAVRKGKRTAYGGHSSDVIADKALAFLESKRDAKRPFVLFCHFKAPHDTWEYAKRYEALFADVEIPEPPTLFDSYEGRPALKKTLQYIGSSWGHHTDFVKQTRGLEGRAKKRAQYQLYMKKYLRCVRGVDDNVGRILEALDASGMAKRTVVFYTSDQGFFLGEHGLYDKRFMYEEALRVPLLVRGPGTIPPGTTSDRMVLNLDLAPTLLTMAGQAVPAAFQGRSLEPLCLGTSPAGWRTSMYYRYYRSHFETEPHYGLRTATHKLIHFHRLGHWELFDLGRDPLELDNLADRPEHRELRARLTRELTRLQRELGDDPDNHGDRPGPRARPARPGIGAPDIDTVPADLEIPPLEDGPPAAGRRVRQALPGYEDTEVYHVLALPRDWEPGKTYPVIVEFAGNGPFRNSMGDVSTGRVEGSRLGHGISGGTGAIWLCVPYLDGAGKKNVTNWWGDRPRHDPGPSLAYLKRVVPWVCEQYGGNEDAVVLAGFSRGAIACNFLGLYDDEVADLWCGFVAYSHYDGVVEVWGYPGSDRASARKRLERLAGRPQFICHEVSPNDRTRLAATKRYLESTGVEAPFTFVETGFRNHSDAWTLRPSPARRALRAWFRRAVDGSQR